MPPRKDDPFRVTPDEERSVDLPEPSSPALTYRGEGLSAGLVMRLWRTAQKLNQHSRKEILEARAYRRREESSLIHLAQSWVRTNPEAAQWVVDIRPERTTIDEVLVSLAGAVEPEYIREALGFLDRDHEDAEACQAWMEEWRQQDVPTQAMFGKAVEDGSFGWDVLPTFLDREGCPTFFETLEEDAYAAMPKDEQKSYRKDDDDRRGKRYVKVDSEGKKQVRPEYGKKDDKKSREAHKDAIATYLLQHKPLAVRLIPALDCGPILKRARNKDRWECAALISRELMLPEELVEAGYGWPGLGDRLLVPMAYNADGSSVTLTPEEFGAESMVYLYTARLICLDEQRRQRPVLVWTVGGSATSWTSDGPGVDDADGGDVGMIDFYDALCCTQKDCTDPCCGVQGPLWGYSGGMHSEDDNPDFYWRPALSHVIPLIKQLEGNRTSQNAHIAVEAFQGEYIVPDAALAAVDGVGEAAMLEEDGSLRIGKKPRPGEREIAIGQVIPAVPARISPDSWQKTAGDEALLAMVSAAGQQPDPKQSGHAQIVGDMMSQRSKRQVREGVAHAHEGMGTAALKILAAYHHRFDVGWPIQTVQERAIGDSVVEARDIAQFDKRWVGQGNWTIATEYPEEENLARVDMEVKLVQAGVGNPERVWRALGERDFATEWAKALKWQIKFSPEYLAVAKMKYAQATGNADMVNVLKMLQDQQQITKGGAPGAKNGIPTAALPRSGGAQPAPQADMVGSGSDIRGGIEGAIMTGDRKVADAEAALTRTNGAA